MERTVVLCDAQFEFGWYTKPVNPDPELASMTPTGPTGSQNLFNQFQNLLQSGFKKQASACKTNSPPPPPSSSFVEKCPLEKVDVGQWF